MAHVEKVQGLEKQQINPMFIHYLKVSIAGLF